VPTILPPLEVAAAIEVTSIHSVAGRMAPGSGLMTVPPFCAPHHTSSMASIVGGGSGVISPGAVSLAHLGILFLDEAPEFHRDVLDALRQPLESGQVVIARAGTQAVFPARFTLVLAANPCPCAKTAGPGKAGCSCSPAARRRYLARISGPLLDRVDVKVRLQPVSRRDMLYDRKFAEPSAVVAQRVAAARERCKARLTGTPWRMNAEIPGTALRSTFSPQSRAVAALDRVMELGQVSARGVDKIVRVAWSLTDLDGKDRPGPDQVNLAIALWLGVAQ
jgi:magnesium chelatase family protein